MVALILAVLLVITFLFILTVSVYGYYGGFKSVEPQTSSAGGETIVYRELQGDYSQTGDVMDAIYEELLELDTETGKSISLYYDDPKKIKKIELRSEAGAVLEGDNLKKTDALKEKFKIKTIAKTPVVQATFPYKGLPSVMVASKKVYPEMRKFIKKENLTPKTPWYEIYDMENGLITYRIPVEKL